MERHLIYVLPPTVAYAVLTAATLLGCRPATVAAAPSPAPALGQTQIPAPPFLPQPPEQKTRWSAPTGKDADGLPPALITASETLFAQGLADPRGGEYQTITVEVGSVWGRASGPVETHGWVLPQTGEGNKRFAVCWNGLVYPVVAVKGAANLKADIEALAASPPAENGPNPNERRMDLTLMWSHATPEGASVSVEHPALLKVVYLLRLGEWELARTLYRRFDDDLPPRTNGNDAIRRDPYAALATKWAWAAYDRAVCAHMRGADALAAADAELLTQVQPLVEAEVAKRKYDTQVNGAIHTEGRPYLAFLDDLPALREDSRRRLREPKRPPLDLKALKSLPQSQRIARLIERLDEIDARQMGQPGGVGLDDHPIPQALIAEGDAAVDALLDVIERDERLTRSVSFGRDFFPDRDLLTVRSAAFSCFARITDVTQIGKGSPSVAELRSWWEKNRGRPAADRWFAQLADDGESPPAQDPAQTSEERDRQQSAARDKTYRDRNRWSEAAGRIVERADIRQVGGWVNVPLRKPGQPLPPFKGEALRARRGPSVSDLLRRRALELSDPNQDDNSSDTGFSLAAGATFALMLYEWEPRGTATLPTLRELMRRCVTFRREKSVVFGRSDSFQLSGRIARLTAARLRLRDNAAAVEYGAYLNTVTPNDLGHETNAALWVLEVEKNNPAMRAVAAQLFAETGPPTAWKRLLADPVKPGYYRIDELFASGLLALAPFRSQVIQRLADRTEAGVITKNAGESGARVSWKDGSQGSGSYTQRPGEGRQNLRTCDRVAMAVQRVQGVPRFEPLDSEPERDRQCAAIAAYLTRYGPMLGRKGPESAPLYGYGAFDFEEVGPVFPIRQAPATQSDVAARRAVFALSGPRKRVVADLVKLLPLEAQWDTDPDGDTATQAGGKTVHWSRGWVWQAEEEWDGKKWVRYYGYVGPHSIVKVPASEIKIVDYRAQSKAKM